MYCGEACTLYSSLARFLPEPEPLPSFLLPASAFRPLALAPPSEPLPFRAEERAFLVGELAGEEDSGAMAWLTEVLSWLLELRAYTQVSSFITN